MSRVHGLIVLVGVSALLAGCSGGGSSAGRDATNPPAQRLDVLVGAPATPAVNALTDVGPVPADPADAAGGFLLTRLDVVLEDTATVADLNAAAATVGATAIVYSTTGLPFLTLAIPRQSNGAALNALAELLESHAEIAFAAPGREFESTALPGVFEGQALPPTSLSHLLASRFPAAWNVAFTEHGNESLAAVQRCDVQRPNVVLFDTFGESPVNGLSQLVDASLTLGRFSGTGPNLRHGWNMLGVLAGAFDATAPTGADPLGRCIDLTLVDGAGHSSFAALGLLQQGLLAQVGNSVLVSPYAFPDRFCGANGDQQCTQQTLPATPTDLLRREMRSRVVAAILWASLTTSDIENRTLTIQSAANYGYALYPGLRDGSLTTPLALARKLHGFDGLYDPSAADSTANELWTSAGLPPLLLDDATLATLRGRIGALSHVPTGPSFLLVGSGTNAELLSQVQASNSTSDAYDILAVGEGITMLDGSTNTLGGSSYATAQVGGLVAYLWSISNLGASPVSSTLDALIDNAVGSVIDAYSTTLALDLFVDPDPGIREALLDVNSDGRFDNADLLRFEAAYGLDDPSTPSIPSARDYGRFDLNGDGATGGVITNAFDLDRDNVGSSSARINAVDAEIEGYPITFSEAALSDIQILCFYAYSPLFADGSPTAEEISLRTNILGPEHCVGVRLTTSFPASITTSGQLSLLTELPNASGGFDPAPNMHLTLTPACGAVATTTGTTDGAGQFSTTVTPAEGCDTVSVLVRARGTPNGPILAQTSVAALVEIPPGPPTFEGQYLGTWETCTWGEGDPPQCIVYENEIVDLGPESTYPGTGFTRRLLFLGPLHNQCGAPFPGAYATVTQGGSINGQDGACPLYAVYPPTGPTFTGQVTSNALYLGYDPDPSLYGFSRSFTGIKITE